MNRRGFLLSGAAAAITAARAGADPLGLPIGCQTYPLRDKIGTDFEGTLREIHAAGFRAIEMCSPPSYTAGFGPLVSLKATEMRQKISAAGLICESCHYQFRELKENLDERLAFARELGLKQMILSTFGIKKGSPMAEWTKAAEALNAIGDKTQASHIQLGYHNHDGEFETADGALVYDRLLGVFDPKLVKMQFQTSVISLGFSAARYFRQYPGRFLSMHLADWSAEQKQQVALGKGAIEWKDLFAAAKTAGVRNYFVEMNMDLMKESVPYLHAI
jgi:sugar phosphate isomerase/epimerase